MISYLLGWIGDSALVSEAGEAGVLLVVVAGLWCGATTFIYIIDMLCGAFKQLWKRG